ncbi:hypothetical protein V8D89_016310, partial [Ganoderma adspersum]
PKKPVLPVLTNSEHEDGGDPAPTVAQTTRGRGRGCGRGRGRGTPSTRTTVTWAAKKASERAESDSDVGDNSADVKTSNSASEEDAEDAVATRTPSKRDPKARPQDHEEDDVPAPVKHGRGCPPKAKAVKSPELVPSEEDEPAAPKGRSSTKPLKTGMKKNYAEEEVLVEDTPQKTPKKRIGQCQPRDA